MSSIRLWLAGLTGWLLLFYNLERFHEPINIASFVYIVTAGLTAVAIATPLYKHVSISNQLLGVLPCVLFLKWLVGYQVGGQALPLSITELVCIAITIAIANQTSQALAAYGQTLDKLASIEMLRQWQLRTQNPTELYREVQRARKYGRNLAVVAIGIAPADATLAAERAQLELQRHLNRRSTHALLGKSIMSEVRDVDLIGVEEDHFLVLVPETSGGELINFCARIRQAVRQTLGVNPRVGAALFPDDEVTYVGLVENAVRNMQSEEIEDKTDLQKTPKLMETDHHHQPIAAS